MMQRGAEDVAAKLSNEDQRITVEMMGVTHGNSTDGIAEMHYEIISQILRQNRDKTVTAYYQGIVVSAFNATQLGPLLDEATGQGLAVVAFENDPYPLSQLCHAATVTNNTFLGAQLAKVLNQITPQGGTFATIFMPAGPAHVERQFSFRNERVNQSDGVWTELPPAAVTSVAMALERAEEFAQLKLKAIGTLVNVPFLAPSYEAFVDRHRDKGLINVGLGDAERHMNLLARRHVHGLVGHMFYDWGSLSVEQLLNVVEGEPVEKDGKFTNAIAHIQVPIDLPELVIDENRVGKLAILGHVFFGITAFAGLLCGLLGVALSQNKSGPSFPTSLSAHGSSRNCHYEQRNDPLGFDDSHGDSEFRDIAICMSVPWLVCAGFAVAFGALFIKTSRVNRIFKSGSAITRIQVSTKDVMFQFCALLVLNFAVLICWTIFDPWTYGQSDNLGRDPWNRVTSTSGACHWENICRFLIALAIINMLSLAVANWQACQGRRVNAEISKSKCIGLACVSVMQTALMGIPILIVVQNQLEALCVVSVCIIFIVSMAVLLLIFVLKFVLRESYNRCSANTQNRRMQQVIREAAASSGPSGKQDSALKDGSSETYQKTQMSGMDFSPKDLKRLDPNGQSGGPSGLDDDSVPGSSHASCSKRMSGQNHSNKTHCTEW